MAYITVTEFKTYKGITESNDDTLISTFIDRAQAYIEDRHVGTGRKFEASADTTRYFDAVTDVGDGDGYGYYGSGEFRIVSDRYRKNRTLFLDEDLCQITSITNGDGVTVANTEYVTEPRNLTPFRRITLKSGSTTYWTWQTSHENAITIIGRWAYSITPDNEVKEIMCRLVNVLYERRNNMSVDSDRPLMTEGGFVLMPAELPKDISRWIVAKRINYD